MKKVALIFGTRPEAIKMAPVYRAMQKSQTMKPEIWLTGQHSELIAQVMRAFGMRSHKMYDLMRENQTLTHIASRVLAALEGEFRNGRPDCVLVQGDTTSAMAAALASFYAKIPIGHVEAGLRTGDICAPYPEEVNRGIIARLANFHFAPTELSKQNLLGEGVRADQIWVTGNTVIDALDYMVKRVRCRRPDIPDEFPLRAFEEGKRLVLITAHRRENIGDNLVSICRAIGELSQRYPEVVFVYPVHPNPNVKAPVIQSMKRYPRVCLVEPLNYPAFVWAMDRAYLILTDSGGIQEEAARLRKQVLVMRNATERPEAVEGGAARIVGTKWKNIVDEASRILKNDNLCRCNSQSHSLFGDGRAGTKIVGILKNAL